MLEVAGGSKRHGLEATPPSGPLYVPATIYKRPDPLIYSQAWFKARGLGFTWENPDIKLFEVQGPGVAPKPAEPHALLPNRAHLIRACIWNGSVEAPVVNLLVRFAYLTFGIGGRRVIIGEMLLHDLPVKGAPDFRV